MKRFAITSLTILLILMAAALAMAVNGRTHQVTATTAATELAPADPGRSSTCIYNASAGILYWSHDATVNASTGFALPATSGYCLNYGGQKAALWAVTPSGSALVSVAEEWQ